MEVVADVVDAADSVEEVQAAFELLVGAVPPPERPLVQPLGP